MNVLQTLKYQCYKFCNTVLIIDINHPLRLYSKKIKQEPVTLDLLKSKKNISMIYIHPYKGKIKLDTKQKASEAYTIEYFKKDKNQELINKLKEIIQQL